LAEHAYNTSVTMATGYLPFYPNYGFNPRSNWPTKVEPTNLTPTLYAHWMTSIHKNCLTTLQATCESLGKYYDKGQNVPLEYKDCDLVMLNTKNLNLHRPVKKFDITMMEPFKIDKVVTPMAMQLILPESGKIQPAIQTKLLVPFWK
jgi:hypothetical protein